MICILGHDLQRGVTAWLSHHMEREYFGMMSQRHDFAHRVHTAETSGCHNSGDCSEYSVATQFIGIDQMLDFALAMIVLMYCLSRGCSPSA